MRKKIAGKSLLIGLGVWMLCSTCYTPIEGCLDINATNYQVDTDRSCGGCCTYPDLTVDFQHKVVLPDTVYNLVYEDSTYFDGAGNAFSIRNIDLYFSEAHLVRPDGSILQVTDTLQLPVEQADGSVQLEVIEDNFTQVNPGVFGQKTMGKILGSGSFNQVQFKLGVPDPANLVAPVEFPLEHPLADTALYIDQTEGRLFYRIDLFRIQGQADTIETRILISGSDQLRTLELPVDEPAEFYLDPGRAPKIELRIDYLTWFRDVDLVTDPPSLIAEKIVNNATQSFSVINVTAN